MPPRGVDRGRAEQSYLLGGAFVRPPPDGLLVVLGQPPGPFDPPPLFPPPPLLPPPPPPEPPEPLPPPPPPLLEPLLMATAFLMDLKDEMTAPKRAGPNRVSATGNGAINTIAPRSCRQRAFGPSARRSSRRSHVVACRGASLRRLLIMPDDPIVG